MTRFGHNLGYVDEMYRAYLADPDSVSEAWQEFFKDYRPESVPSVATPSPPPAAARPSPKSAAAARPLRGVSAKIVENMMDSLEVPTATSVRTMPVKVLEENRHIVNQHQSLMAGPRISFTHLIGWAIVRALEAHPEMNSTFAEIDGKPHLLPRAEIRLGLAIDVDRKGERILLVPNLKDACSLDFPAFVAAYDDLVARARANDLVVGDFEETTVTVTNPGMIGTGLSVPRLMRGQGAIVGVGSIALPAEYSGMAEEMISELGLSKVMTVTSTYDHRVIQGAESGGFLATIEGLLQGRGGFYSRVFAELGVPREPVEWSGDRYPAMLSNAGSTEAIAKQAGVLQLIRAFRVRGHLWSDLDPLDYSPEPTPELELSTYGLTVWDMDRRFIAGGLGGHTGTLKLREILDTLQRTYCRHVGVEYMHIQHTPARHWIQERMERIGDEQLVPREMQIHILKMLNRAEAFETFLHTSYVGQKRFSLEGAETLIPMLSVMLGDAAEAGIGDVVMGLAHRGRLNVLAHIVGKSYGQIFREFEGADPASAMGSGDVKYHLGAAGTFEAPNGKLIRITVASNPSHLEAVNPVIEGMTRARQDLSQDHEREKVLPVLLHGDAAFAGQGVVAETLNLSKLSGYRTGGTVHVVVNNQIGFTTGPGDARSSKYATDVAKMTGSPILHVNGDEPEEAVRVMRDALAFRQRFKNDVVVDLFCYRRWGHNEADDPSYTHPILYSKIKSHRSVRKLYTEQLLRRGDLDVETAEKALEDYRKRLREVHDEVRAAKQAPKPSVPADREAADGSAQPTIETGVDAATLRAVVTGLRRCPEDFELHPKLVGQFEQREKRFDEDRIDWALAEALAFGSLVLQGTAVRLSGEDSGRGTFSQRHAVLYDHRTAAPWVPLANLHAEQATFNVYDSLLSEFAVLGFDYGYSVDHPRALVIWEAQFGDFSNGAQVIIDQFIASAEAKWGQQSGLVMLLPHGYEGQGPEHSSARLERFLQLAACGNLQIANPTTPAQYFHLIRRQVRQSARKPLVVMTPKSLLRLPACVSAAAELERDRFHCVLDDSRRSDRSAVRRLVLCSGKIFYDLDARRGELDVDHVAICRIEQLYPFPRAQLVDLLASYGSTPELIWTQEEPRNMGAWRFISERLPELVDTGRTLGYAGRPAQASPATGSARRHKLEQAAVIERALGVETPAV